MNKSLILLLITGTALGLNFPLGKLAVTAGIDPLLWACFISLGAGLAMAIIQAIGGLNRPGPGLPLLRFSLVSGFLSYVVPNGLTFFLIPKIGAGLAAIMFALSPVFTALVSIALKVRPPNRWMLAGISFGLAGALIIILGRSSLDTEAGGGWLMLAMLIPIFLGLGNVYRTRAWPEQAAPHTLAATTNLAAVLPLLLLAIWQAGQLPLAALLNQPVLMLAQLAVSTVMFLAFFRLQQAGGPTYLSQIGYVAAAVGLLIGVAVMGESYPWGVWAGAAVIATGIGLSTLGQMLR